MLRILHSLPRTHKFLLLPVATMVTVLGAQKLITTYHDHSQPNTPVESVFVPLADDAAPGVPALARTDASLTKTPVANAIDHASRLLDATRENIPLSELQASEIIDLDVIDSATASPVESPRALPADRLEAEGDTRLDEGARHIAIVIGTLGSGMLAADSVQASPEQTPVTDATSYEDYGIDSFDDVSFLPLEIAAQEPYVPQWKTHIINTGETFAIMAQNELGMGYSEVLALLDELPDANIFTRWRAGQSFDYQVDKNGKLLTLKMMKNIRDGVLINRQEGEFEIEAIERKGEPVQRLYAGTLSGSFARSAEATGLSSGAVTELTHLLKKKFDFRRDSRRGDEFQVLVESDMIDGETLGSRVLAVKYHGQRMDLTLVRNAMNDTFYTPDGHSLDPAFARYPFNGSYRLSSNFNPNRHHPVTGRISPHNGTDFAMPIGTPVIAPAGGRVERVVKHYAAGRYVVIRHDNGYRTRYLHLSKALVHKGDRVEMGDKIALSGNTGRSTGPHLHYEVHVNNAPVNAMKVKLPENTRLRGDSLVAFQQQAKPMVAALESGDTGTVSVAAYRHSDTGNDDG
ncbi:MAG: peptidoglycan DD-metalloendopeptidase family protein [Halomonas sp.]|nr:peptidoglycan DD-metalloendopeptidase family protein [Halomonas sp.]MDN6298115.1 peptidoglycan DD-metalloendopeptidase family protein [Halomonas sp.]MDN6315438.1 peptidoglycan DD-metalloendopeptidase family protein [Halomonas sp.]MDN6336742.1 peptidoglycan DD-metalloendopeptidase family protein [Halomonas sp.]